MPSPEVRVEVLRAVRRVLLATIGADYGAIPAVGLGRGAQVVLEDIELGPAEAVAVAERLIGAAAAAWEEAEC